MFVTELCDGSLVDYIKRHECSLSEHQVRNIALQLIRGLRHLHSQGVAHRDIKVENILMVENTAKLGDFGSASREHAINYQTAAR